MRYNHSEPFIVDVMEMLEYLANVETTYASAKTVDGTLLKRISQKGIKYIVKRRYCGFDNDWDVIYEGGSSVHAVQAFNRLG